MFVQCYSRKLRACVRASVRPSTLEKLCMYVLVIADDNTYSFSETFVSVLIESKGKMCSTTMQRHCALAVSYATMIGGMELWQLPALIKAQMSWRCRTVPQGQDSGSPAWHSYRSCRHPTRSSQSPAVTNRRHTGSCRRSS